MFVIVCAHLAQCCVPSLKLMSCLINSFPCLDTPVHIMHIQYKLTLHLALALQACTCTGTYTSIHRYIYICTGIQHLMKVVEQHVQQVIEANATITSGFSAFHACHSRSIKSDAMISISIWMAALLVQGLLGPLGLLCRLATSLLLCKQQA